jgi:4-hydroxy-2-oxoglutarate aldolase
MPDLADTSPRPAPPGLPAARDRPALAGLFAPICTPFGADEALDLGALRANLERYAAAGIHGYLALGSNGENRSLTEEERLAVLDVVVRHRGPAQIVLAGATYDGQRQAEAFLIAAADLGADFGLVLAPGYFRRQMTVEVLYRYFHAGGHLAAAILLYNAGLAARARPELVARLAGLPASSA